MIHACCFLYIMATLNASNSTTQEPLEDRIKRLPPFEAIFDAGGPPCSSALQFYLSELDNKLEQNSRDIDSCLQGLLRFTNDLPGERVFSTPKDGLLYMYNSHVLEKDSCYDPEIEEAVAILDALLRHCEEAGNEEEVLQDVLSLASSEGLLLPLRMSGLEAPDPAVISSASLHAIMDSSDQIIEQRWNKLASCLKQYLHDQLLQLPTSRLTSHACWGRGNNLCLDRRVELAESLRVLCSDENAWHRYRAVRTQQLENLMAKLMPEVEEEGLSHKDFARNCGTLAESVMTMIDEDFVVLNSGIFRKETAVFKALHELYLEKFSDEMSVLVDEIGDEISKSSKQPVKQSKSDHGLLKNNLVGSSKPKDGGHRNSVGGVSNSKESGVMAAPAFQTHSLDSMFTTTAATSAQDYAPASESTKKRSTFPEDCMQSLLSIVLALMRLEDHIESLLRLVAWDISGLPPKKTRRKASIRGVLKSAASPEGRRYSAHSLQYQHSGSFSSSDTQLDLLMNNPHGDVSTAPKVVEHSRVEERFRWEWKLIFKKLTTELSQGVESMLQDQMQASLAAELTLWEKKHVIEVVTTDAALQGGKLDYPKVTSLASHQFLEVVDRLLPLARVGCDGCLTSVRASFIDIICICLKNFHVQLLKMCKEVPGKAPLKQLYIMQATSVMIRNNLLHYENLLSSEESGKKPFAALLRQYGDLIDALMKQTVQLHSQAMATSILMDADSSDWANIKDFYEDERCSFTVQMWNLHLRGLRHDLWSICSPQRAQGIFSSVLQDSLLALMQRYVRVRPSFRRFKQFRYDITAILLCVLDHLLWACNSPSKLLDPGHGQLPHYSIHNLCSNLLAALAVVASPLDSVYRVFRKGFAAYKETLTALEGTSQSGNSQWLHFMWPALFQPKHKHYDDLPTTSALYLHLTLLLRQPQPNWGLLIQALLMKEFSLSIILLTRSLMEVSTHTSHSESLDNLEGEGKISEPLASAKRAVFAMVNIMAHVQEFPTALTKCILPAIERCDEWEIFNVKTTSAGLKPPLWMEGLFCILNPLVEKIMEPMLFFLVKEKSPDASRDSLMSRLQDLPCGCQSNSSELAAGYSHKHNVQAKDLVRRCLELMIDSTQENMYSISRPICILFQSLQTACNDRSIRTPHSCVAVQVIAWAVWLKMKDVEAMKTTVGLHLTQHHLSTISLLAEYYYQIMVFGKAKGAGTPRLASKFHKTHREWLPQKINAITKYLTNDTLSEPDTDIMEGATSVFIDTVALEMTASVTATPTGQHDLHLIYCLIRSNSQWLLQHLDIASPLPQPKKGPGDGQGDGKVLRFQVKLTPEAQGDKFVPTAEHNSMGICDFDQEAIMAFDHDWIRMLTSDLGLSQQAFLALLTNRHEMQPSAVLDDTERKLVDALRSALNLQ